MNFLTFFAIITFAIVVTATPVPQEISRWTQGQVAEIRLEYPTTTGDDRMDMGGGLAALQGMDLTDLATMLGRLALRHGNGKRPFEEISGPYMSSLGRGYEVPGGFGGIPFGAWGNLPLIGGPLSGVMGIPLMMILGQQ